MTVRREGWGVCCSEAGHREALGRLSRSGASLVMAGGAHTQLFPVLTLEVRGKLLLIQFWLFWAECDREAVRVPGWRCRGQQGPGGSSGYNDAAL